MTLFKMLLHQMKMFVSNQDLNLNQLRTLFKMLLHQMKTFVSNQDLNLNQLRTLGRGFRLKEDSCRRKQHTCSPKAPRK
jgi:hypothetical protein